MSPALSFCEYPTSPPLWIYYYPVHIRLNTLALVELSASQGQAQGQGWSLDSSLCLTAPPTYMLTAPRFNYLHTML